MINDFYRIKKADIAAAMGLHPQTVTRLIHERRLPPYEVCLFARSGRFWYLSTLRAFSPDLARVVENHLRAQSNPPAAA